VVSRTLLVAALLLNGCVRVPEGVTVVEGFEADRYLGTWYEIARLDHRFERGLTSVSATYSARPDGGLDVVNEGYNEKKHAWERVTGKAYFVEGRGTGRLKVSFFGPFYGAYNIIMLDKSGYRYSLVCGPNRSYLWVLTREREPDAATVRPMVEFAGKLGFETDSLIYVEQDATPPSRP
jgi:apolipoprotein D and lipocalin family protein